MTRYYLAIRKNGEYIKIPIPGGKCDLLSIRNYTGIFFDFEQLQNNIKETYPEILNYNEEDLCIIYYQNDQIKELRHGIVYNKEREYFLDVEKLIKELIEDEVLFCRILANLEEKFARIKNSQISKCEDMEDLKTNKYFNDLETIIFKLAQVESTYNRFLNNNLTIQDYSNYVARCKKEGCVPSESIVPKDALKNSVVELLRETLEENAFKNNQKFRYEFTMYCLSEIKKRNRDKTIK